MATSKEQQAAYNEARRRILELQEEDEIYHDFLDLSALGLVNLPLEINELTALTSLDLSGNELTSLPPDIGNLTKLTTLDLYSNQLTSLPSEIGNLTALTTLDLTGSQLISLPSEICNLTKLTTLDLTGNQLTSLPSEIGKLTKLTTLDLTGNQLTNLPSEIGKLTKLTTLDLTGNQFTSLPPEISKLIALTTLNLFRNQLPGLSPEIGNLTKLTELDLSENQFASLPPEIGKLTTLTSLNLSENQFTSLPPEIDKLTTLTELNLSYNQFTNLPPEIDKLTKLTELNLSENQLTNLPPEIGKLTKLTELNLSENQFTNLPPEIDKLTALTGLNLFDNQFTNLPPEIGKLTALTTLSIHNNQLTNLPPEIGELTAVTTLSLSKNQLSSLPPEIGKLTALTALYLFRNQLPGLPPEIGKLTKLTELNLSDNQLTSLPPEIGELTSLAALYLHGNPGLNLPPEILGPTRADIAKKKIRPASPKAILDYYFARQTQGTRCLNEVKLLLVGRGEAGKTSLSRALRQEAFQRDQGETPGIEIEPWTLHCPEGEPVKVHLWDFAGQEITHETHRFFLTERSLYVVVLDGRGGQQMEEAEYWLSHAERYGSRREGDKVERSPVIVVLNKWCSPGPYDVEKRRLQREYPNIRAFVETDCKENNYGIEKLRQTICAVLDQMPAVRQAWPQSYFKVRQRLDALAQPQNANQRRHFLNWEDYRQVCAECGVSDQGQQTSLAENLNALGVALYYGDDERLRDTRVLNPNWAANGLYGLVRGVHRKPFKDKPGQLWQGEFPSVLTEGMRNMNEERGATIDDYPVERDGVRVHDFLLELMQDRELGFLADEYEGQPLYLLPGLLTLDEPEPGEYDIAAHMESAEVRFRYLYELLPAGVMSRFIVRTHPLSDDLFRWQRGVVLGWGNARALVMAERRRNPRVDVFIRGGSAGERQELAGVVRANMEDIHNGLPEGLRGREELDLTVGGDQYEEVTKLERLEAENKPVQVVTPRGVSELPVEKELEQVQPAKARRKSAPKLKVFISYAHANYKLWERLKTHLDILKNEGQISVWFDGKIRPGSEWDDAIRKELKEADIVIVLLSNAFFASKYIQGIEMKEARRRHQAGDAEILPVLLEPSEPFVGHKWLNKLQAVPSVNGQLRPISSFNPGVNGWHLVEKALRAMIEDVADWKRPMR